ncbi:hypothetical protein BVY03_00180, partial [bacterium K02(2017)]
MYLKIFTIFFLVLIALPAIAKKKKNSPPSNPTSEFDAAQIKSDRDYVLNDTIEFALFDISELKLINQSKKIKLNKKVIDPVEIIKENIKTLPNFFYKELEQQLLAQTVPITLYPENSPSYAKPLKLFIKIKQIQLKPLKLSQDGVHYSQPIKMRIYGQISDKKSDDVLIKFYDSASAEFTIGKNNTKKAFKSLSNSFMADLSHYLRGK